MSRKRKAKPPEDPVKETAARLKRAVRYHHGSNPGDEAVVKMAGLLHLVSDEDEREQCLYAIISVFVGSRGRRTRRWGKIWDKLPPKPETPRRIRDCVHAYNRYCGREIADERFDLDQVVKTMVQIPDAKAYVSWCANDDLLKATAVFHPNTLELARKRLRGVFGYDGQGANVRDRTPDDGWTTRG